MKIVPPVDLRLEDLTSHGMVLCPSHKANMQAWNGHPRIYLEILRSKEATCPYCGTKFRLISDCLSNVRVKLKKQ